MKQKAEPVTVEFKSDSSFKKLIKKHQVILKRLSQPKSLVALVLVVIVVIAGLVIKHVDDHKAPPLACSVGRGLSIVKQASTELSPADSFSLSQTALRVLNLKSYQKDPNCLYVLITSAVYQDNGIAATAYLNDFNKVYNGHNLDNILSEYKSVYSLRNSVKTLKKPAYYGIP